MRRQTRAAASERATRSGAIGRIVALTLGVMKKSGSGGPPGSIVESGAKDEGQGMPAPMVESHP